MAEPAQQGVSTGRGFQLLKADPYFMKLWAYAQELIDQEEKKFWNMSEATDEERERAKEQKWRIKHWEEFKGKLDQKIVVTIATMQNNQR